MTDDFFLAEAVAIADRLATQAVHYRDRCSWVTRTVPYSSTVGKGDVFPELMTLNPTIYSGTAGMALLYARLSRYSGREEHEHIARAALNHALEHAWWQDEGSVVGNVGGRWRFGFYLGTLGIAWTAIEIGALLGEPTYLTAARRLVRELEGTLTARPFEHDVIFGAAGGLFALLSATEEELPGRLHLATRLGDHLLAQGRRSLSGAGLSWSGGQDHPDLTGFSHGTAGIGAALLSLHAATGESRFLDGGRAAFTYEDEVFDAEAGNWPNFQAHALPDGRYPCTSSWCHGGPGIGLSRVIAHRALGSQPYLRDVEVAARTTRAQLRQELARPGKDVMPCHGVAGHADVLWLLEEELGDPGAIDWQREAGRHLVGLHGTAARALYGPTTEWPTGVTAGMYPPLVTGVAGVAHWLLRLHAPEVPSALVPGARLHVTTASPALVAAGS